MLDSGDHAFSFSGLKTSARYLIDKLESPIEESVMNDVCASFQVAVVDVLVAKLESAASQSGTDVIGVSGGVSCNESLRERCQSLAGQHGWQLKLATPGYATDNAAMIGFAAAAHRFAGLEGSSLCSDIDPNLQLGTAS